MPAQPGISDAQPPLHQTQTAPAPGFPHVQPPQNPLGGWHLPPGTVAPHEGLFPTTPVQRIIQPLDPLQPAPGQMPQTIPMSLQEGRPMHTLPFFPPQAPAQGTADMHILPFPGPGQPSGMHILPVPPYQPDQGAPVGGGPVNPFAPDHLARVLAAHLSRNRTTLDGGVNPPWLYQGL